jgi:adenylate cyclase, class 2
MSFINIEVKARTARTNQIRKFLLDRSAVFKGIDFQTDTYFNVPKGRLKLRQGNIENSLIYYERENEGSGPKTSNFYVVKVGEGDTMKELLAQSLGISVTVSKQREIYFIENVKFHLDVLGQLGNFVEVEASNMFASLSLEHLTEQCNYYIKEFAITDQDMINLSYSDMILAL